MDEQYTKADIENAILNERVLHTLSAFTNSITNVEATVKSIQDQFVNLVTRQEVDNKLLDYLKISKFEIHENEMMPVKEFFETGVKKMQTVLVALVIILICGIVGLIALLYGVKSPLL